MARKGQRRKLQEMQHAKVEEEEEEHSSEPPTKKWKLVPMSLEMMQEVESSGVSLVEEVDDQENFGIHYEDGRVSDASRGKGKAKRKAEASKDLEESGPTKKKKSKNKNTKKTKTQQFSEGSAEALEAENARLRRELQAMKESQKKSVEGLSAVETLGAEDEVVDLPEWIRFDLHPLLMRGIKRLGFRKPTEVQARCLEPAIRMRKDVVGAAETGSGKTLAFGLPILHHCLQALATEGASDTLAAELARPTRDLRALAILPTRELAVQVRSHINAVAEGTSVRAECVVGGMSVLKQQRLLRRCPQIVVGTPGRIGALMGLAKRSGEEEKCEWLFSGCRTLRHLVLDEADRLVESGHFWELDKILGHIYDSLERPQQLQTFVFSATLTLDPSINSKWRKENDEEGKVEQLMRRLRFREARAVHTVDLTREEKADRKAGDKGSATKVGDSADRVVKRQLPEKLTFFEAIAADDKDRETLLTLWLLRRFKWEKPVAPASSTNSEAGEDGDKASLFGGGGRVLIFVNAISMVMRLAPMLALLMESPQAEQVLSLVRMKRDKQAEADKGPVVEVYGLHSKMRQKDRLKRMERFRKAKHALLICTDIAARGLDVKDVATVIHFQAPRSVETFVHRSGRTARAGRSGASVAIMAPSDAGQWGKVYRAAGITKGDLHNINQTGFEVAAAKEASRLASDLEKKVHQIDKNHKEKRWFEKAAEEAELMLPEDDDDKDAGRSAAPKKQLWGLYQQLLGRVRRAPRRAGAGPLPKHLRRRKDK
eukprot:TRINITY_DN34760_c1_g1_i1.p1 TRINITY_DN34760_c1_g1~~TRINITY_DN34760_c1_g1_i1.p1  ORF type:complete len:771 (-),score=205.92 TRINITY_DN34760_c1_g1_i1:34-2346(-)